MRRKKKKEKKEWLDPVVEETRERGRAFTARFGNDPKKIMAELRRIQKIILTKVDMSLK